MARSTLVFPAHNPLSVTHIKIIRFLGFNNFSGSVEALGNLHKLQKLYVDMGVVCTGYKP